MKFVIGSSSHRKIKVAEKIVKELFKDSSISVQGLEVKSEVPETPYDKETYEGSKNRAKNSKNSGIDADYFIGLESGLIERYGHIYEEAWATILTKDGREYYGYSSGLKVPDYVLKRMDELKMSHSDVMTIIEEEFGKLPNDTWGTYSGGMIIREVSLEESLRNALIQVVSPDTGFYKK